MLNIAKQKEFLQLNYKWIKSADPQAKVILPGLLGTYSYPVSNSYTWLKNMLGAGAGSFFDVMNYHDYNSWWTLPAHYDSVKTILQNYGLNKPMWITEIGISSMNVSPITPTYSSNDEQAADVWRRLCLLWAKGAEVVFWHRGWINGDLSGWGEFGIIDVWGKSGDSAVFNITTHALTGGSFTFNTLTQFPILVEEQNSISIQNDAKETFNLSLYPNPAQNKLTVSLYA